MTGTRPAPRPQRPSLTSGDPDTVARLEEERDLLLESLRDLEREREAGEIDDADYLTLHEDYTARAAAVLRSIAAGEAASRRSSALVRGGGERPSRRGPPAAHPGSAGSGQVGGRPPWSRKQTLVTAGLIVLGVVLASATVAGVAGSRSPGSPLTGTVGLEGEGRLEEALALERDGRAADALKAYDAILRTEPDNVAALSYRGWLLKRAGLPDEAMASLDRAVAVDPSFPDAHFFRGMVLYQDRDDPAAAVPEFRLFMANRPPPEMVPMVQGVLDRALADAAERTAAAGATTTTSVPASGP